ncbi:MAG: hypothetical protein ACK5V3_18475 [Bdellovibrionales bacterium]
MLLPLQAPEIWDEINQKLQTHLGFAKENPVKLYPNLYVAVDEVTTQIASFLAHKKAFTWIKGFSPIFDGTLSGFLRDGLQVQSVDWKVFEQVTSDPTAWVEALPKDTLFVLGFEEHAITGQKLDLQKIEEALNLKKIYFIRVSHFEIIKSDNEIKPFTIWIGPTGINHRAVVVAGSRFRAPERIVGSHPWGRDEVIAVNYLAADQTLVESFESQWNAEKWFQTDVQRRFDRAVLSFKDISAEALRFDLTQKIQMSGIESLIQSPNTCFLQSIKLLKSWWTPTPQPEAIRGLILISTSVLQYEEFQHEFKKSVESLRQKSLWPSN